MDFPEIFKGTPTPAKWAALGEYLSKSEITGGPGLRVRRVGNKTVITTKKGSGKSGGGGQAGAFWTRYTDEAGDTMLQGGTVTGGNGGSATVADYKVLDADTGVGSLEDDILYLQVACTATIEDGLMMPGCEITTATLETGASVPDNHTFTVAAPSGNLYLEVGRWNATTFLPAGPPGNVLASGCIGNFLLTKVT